MQLYMCLMQAGVMKWTPKVRSVRRLKCFFLVFFIHGFVSSSSSCLILQCCAGKFFRSSYCCGSTQSWSLWEYHPWLGVNRNSADFWRPVRAVMNQSSQSGLRNLEAVSMKRFLLSRWCLDQRTDWEMKHDETLEFFRWLPASAWSSFLLISQDDVAWIWLFDIIIIIVLLLFFFLLLDIIIILDIGIRGTVAPAEAAPLRFLSQESFVSFC